MCFKGGPGSQYEISERGGGSGGNCEDHHTTHGPRKRGGGGGGWAGSHANAPPFSSACNSLQRF